jgi:uncharacterized protein (DUF1800 family)
MADRELVAHLLRRATFGPTADEVDAAERAGVEATHAALLHPAGDDAGAARTPVPDLGPDPYARLARNASRDDRQQANQERRSQIQTLVHWWLSRLVAAEHQLTEKLVFFWHGHWATSVQKVRSGPLMSGHLATMREYGRGAFAELTRAMLRDPALIVWLDGQRNTLQAPNENLARELMELFTLGVGNYTEDDVKAGARALTGWTVDRTTGQTSLNPRRHDSGSKTILGQTANFDTDSYADLLVRQPAHATFLARRMWFRFASGDAIPDAAGARLAAAYGAGRDVHALLAAVLAVLADSGFAATRGQLVKQPVEWLVGALRQLGVDYAALPEQRRAQLLGGLDGLGQVPLRPPSVGGWPAGAAWLTTSSLQVRLRVGSTLSMLDTPGLDRLARGSATARIDELGRLLVVDSWTERTRAALADSGNDARRLLALGLASPEYTLC